MDQPRLRDIAQYLDDPGNRAFLCELHVAGTTLHDWQSVIDLVRSRRGWRTEYVEDGEVVAMPNRADVIFERSHGAATTLRTTPVSLQINTHFFTPEDIEFDVAARDVSDQSRLDELLAFVKEVALATHRPVSVTPEAAQEAPFLIYNPTDDTWTRP